MSSVDSKKTKRRKNKKNTAVKNVMGLNPGPNTTTTTTTTTTTCSSSTKVASSSSPSSCSSSSSSTSSSSVTILQQTSPQQTIKDHPDENLTLPILFTNRGLNSYIDKDRCLLCSCERQDSSSQATWVKSDVGKNIMHPQEVACFSKECLNAASSPILREMNSSSTELSSNGLVCSCVSCLERRQKEEEHRKETLDLQKSWSEVRKAVRSHYSESLIDSNNSSENSSTYNMQVKENIHRLCTRDPHQLFMRLESQAKEFVIEKRKKLLDQLDIGFTCPNEARDFVFLLLEEYRQLCQAASKVSNILTELEKDHLKKFDVTWNIHNKHLFHSIVYTNPSIQDRLPAVLKQLGSASCDSIVEPYPSLSERCCKFGEEMEKVSLMWKSSQKLIASYNEEQMQVALKMKHRMLTEDWEFFKKQRKMLEKRTSESSNPFLPNRSLSNACCLFACSCPCHESTSESVSTCCCRLLNEKCENVSHHQPISLLHDPNHCVLDINPPSISSTTSSSGSSSPIIDSERLSVTFGECTQPFENGGEEMEESQTDDDDEDDEDDDDDDDDDDEDEDDDDEDDDYQEEEEEDEVEEDVAEGLETADGVLPPVTNENLDISIVSWTDKAQKTMESNVDETKTDNCDYHHYISTNPEQIIKPDDNQCQCHFCLRQRGNTVSTSLPQHVPVMPRPAHLHLYPHIHGPSGLHALHGSTGSTSGSNSAPNNGTNNDTNANTTSNSGGAGPSSNNSASSSHTRPILQHQWDVEVQLQQAPKFIISPQSKLSLPLDGFGSSSLNDHEHTYQGDWDNTQFDPRLLLSPHKYADNLGNDLIPCTTSLANSSSPSSDSGLSSQGTVIDNPNPTLTVNRVSSRLDSSPSVEVQVRVQQNEISSQQQHRHHHHHHHQQQQQAPPPPPASTSSSSSCSSSTSSSSTTETCSKAHKWNSQNGTSKNHSCNRPATLGGNSSPHNEKVHPQVCKKHGANPTSGEIASRNGSIVTEDVARQSRSFSSSMLNQYSCTHANNSSNISMRNGNSQLYQSSSNGEPGLCVNAVSLPTTMNNVSVGTSTVCTDPECLVHQEDNEDSVDDSCSEQSSSTSASNQKEGKYCDCCYCEFFGHGTPPKAPTSHKFYEMREKLQQKLKKKKAAMVQKKDDDDLIPDPLDQRGLDDLVRYINGYEDPNWGVTSTNSSEKPISAKAAKRARQKQRKAEEKAKLEAEECDNNCMVVDCQIAQLYSNSNILVKLKKKRIKQKLLDLQDIYSEDDDPLNNYQNCEHHHNQKDDTKKCSTPEIHCQQNSLSLSPKLKSKSMSHRKTETFENDCEKQQRQQQSVPSSDNTKLTAEIDALLTSKCQTKKSKLARKATSNISVLSKSDSLSCSQEETIDSNPAGGNSVNGAEKSKGKSVNLSSNSVKDFTDHKNGHESSSSKKSKKSLERSGSSGNKLSNGNCSKSTSRAHNDIQAQILSNSTSWQQFEATSPKDQAWKEAYEQKVAVDDRKSLRSKDGDKRLEGSNSVPSIRAVDQRSGKSKRNKKKNKTSDFVDVFLPKSESDLENGEMDEAERELEEFKRFCLDSTQQKKDKLQVNMNLKDIFNKKKGVTCS